jgi:protein-L-isoaspartate(D-aspartate) O-methyltransferase
MKDFETARINMVKGQILPNNIANEALIEVVTKLPRHIFVPEDKQGIAYIDGRINVGSGRYMLPPMILAKMVEALDIKGNESALDIACGTGYSSAVLANLCKKVFAIEPHADLASKAHQNLNKLSIGNVIIISNQLADGHEEGSPYDIILINGSVKAVPEKILNQLSENGKLIVIINKTQNLGAAVLFSKKNGLLSSREIFDVNLPPIEEF